MKNRDHSAVREGLPALLPRLWRFGLVLSGRRDVAEDLVQATCVRALERATQFRPGTRLDHWAFAILSSIWKNQLRAEKIREGAGFVDATESLWFDGRREAETNILARRVLTEVQSLPEAQRSTLLLVYVEGLSYREAAAVLDVPMGTVMSRLAAARQILADRMGDPAERGTSNLKAGP